MIAGSPTWSRASAASAKSLIRRERGVSRPMAVIASRNCWRSSAFSMAARSAPISSTPYFSRVPLRDRERAVFSAVWPPMVGSRASGRSRSMTLATISGVIGSI